MKFFTTFRKPIYLTICAFLGLLSFVQPAHAQVLYVDADASGGNDGTSWAECLYGFTRCPGRSQIREMKYGSLRGYISPQRTLGSG